MIQELPTTHVFPRRDSRKLDEAVVRLLVESIGVFGIMNPLRVRPARRMIEGVEADAYEVVAGGHRLKAAQKLGLGAVPCEVVTDDDLHAELAMIDENLLRSDLGPAEKSVQTIRRKAIYEELHPETRLGTNQHTRGFANFGESSELASRFTADMAAATGKSERSVQRVAERGEKISEQALRLVSRTDLDTGDYLDKLKKVEPAKQVQRVNADLEKAEQVREMERRNRNTNRAAEMTTAQQYAEWLLLRSDASEFDLIISFLEGTKPKDVISALRREAA